MQSVRFRQVPDGGMLEVPLRFPGDDAAQREQGNQVRDGHEAVDNIGQDPDGFQFQEGAAGDEHDEDHAVRQDGLDAGQVDDAAFAVVVLVEDRREGEQHKVDHEDDLVELRIGL